MKIRAGRLKGCKERGEWAELCFMARAAAEGLLVSKPWGDSASYDVGVEYKGSHFRVQVKSTMLPRRGSSFRLGLIGPMGLPYAPGQIEFLAAYLISVDRWYIVPWHRLRTSRGPLRKIQITPGTKRGKWSAYSEAWHLLRGETRPDHAAESPHRPSGKYTR